MCRLKALESPCRGDVKKLFEEYVCICESQTGSSNSSEFSRTVKHV